MRQRSLSFPIRKKLFFQVRHLEKYYYTKNPILVRKEHREPKRIYQNHRYKTDEKYRKKNNQMSRDWKQNNPEYIKISSKEYNEKNSEIIAEKKKLRYEENRDWQLTYRRKRITYKGKRIHLDYEIRTGICVICKRTVKDGQIKQTNMHHIFYNDEHPDWGLIEVCPSCHRKIHSTLDISNLNTNFEN